MCSWAPHMASPRDTCEDATARWGGCFGCFAFLQRWPSQPSQRRLLGYLNVKWREDVNVELRMECHGAQSATGPRRDETILNTYQNISWYQCQYLLYNIYPFMTFMFILVSMIENRCLFVYPIFFFSWQQDLAGKADRLGLEDHDVCLSTSLRNVKRYLWKEEILNWRISDVPLNLLFILRTAFWCFLPPSTFSQLFPASPKGATSGAVSSWMRLMLKFCQIWIKPAKRCNVHNGALSCDDVCKWHRSLSSGMVGCGWEGWGWKMLKHTWWLTRWKALAVPTFYANFS